MKNRYPFPDLSNLPEDIQQRITEVQQKSGFVPNVFLAFARRPAAWTADGLPLSARARAITSCTSGRTRPEAL